MKLENRLPSAEKFVKHEYDIDVAELYHTILKKRNDPGIVESRDLLKLSGTCDSLEYYASFSGLNWKNQLKNKIPLIIPSTDNYYHAILSIDLCYRTESKIKSFLDYQQANFQGNMYAEKNDFISLVEFVCHKSITNFCIGDSEKKLSIIMEWVREQQHLKKEVRSITFILEPAPPTNVLQEKRLSLGCKMSTPQVVELFKGMQKNLLAEGTQLSSFEMIFDKELKVFETPIHCNESNRLLAYFFDRLYQEHLITNRNWKSVIEKCRMWKNASSKLITANDLSVAISESTGYGYPEGHKEIDSLISNIKRLRIE